MRLLYTLEFKRGKPIKIYEAEQRTGLKRDTIRYYEDEGLLQTNRLKNGYREYSEDNILTLKKIILLRKTGMRIDDIRQIINGESTLLDLLPENKKRLIQEAEEIEGALRLCDYMQKNNISFQSMDVDNLNEIITNMENEGLRFSDILETTRDFIKQEINDHGLYYGFGNFKPVYENPWLNMIILITAIFVCTLFLAVQMNSTRQFSNTVFSILRILLIGAVYLFSETLVNSLCVFVLKKRGNIHIIRAIALIIAIGIIAIMRGVLRK